MRLFFRALLMLIACGLIIDAIYLMSIGHFQFGVILPFGLGFFFLIINWKWQVLTNWRRDRYGRQILWNTLCTLFCLWLCSVVVFFHFIGEQAGRTKSSATNTNILILGSGTAHCKPSATLLNRLNAGLDWARYFPDAKIIVSGGKDWRHDCSEAQIMAGYLTAHGISLQRIIQENQSTSTYENFLFSKYLLDARSIPATNAMLVVTSDFHLPRALLIAHKAGFTQVSGIGAETPLYIRYNAWIREYFAFISGYILREY